MRPQRGLIHGERVIRGVNPEQHDDAVDTGEADKDPQSEDAVQSQLVLPCTLQVPDHRDGEPQDHKVDHHVEDLVGDEELVLVHALRGHRGVPETAQRAALQPAGDEDGQPPGDDERVETEREALEGWGREDAAVEADNRRLDCGTEGKVGELVCQEDLAKVHHRDGI